MPAKLISAAVLAMALSVTAAKAVVFPTVAAMKSSTVSSADDAAVAGFASAGDGGGGAFYFDPASAAADDGCTIFAPTVGGGRWKRIYSGPVNIDWCGANNGGDAQAAFLAASAFPSIMVPNRHYRMDGSVSIGAGQQWKFDGAVITHTDNTKVMFKAVAVDGWRFAGPVTLTGLLSSSCGSSCPGEKGLYVEAARDFFVSDVMATLFLGPAIHVAPGTRAYSPFLGDTGQWSNIHADQSMVGFQGDAGTAAEYQSISNLTATGNITGVQLAAGNWAINGCNIVKNNNYGLVLQGGSNNGHGIVSGCNINHNPTANVVIDGVTNGFTLNGVHIYGDGGVTGEVWFKNGSADVAIMNSVIDAAVIHDSSASNRLFNTKKYSNYSLGGSNPSGLIEVGGY